MALFCRLVCHRLPEYVDGSLNPVLSKVLDRHLAHCPSCQAALDELNALLSRVNSPIREIFSSQAPDNLIANSIAKAKGLPSDEALEKQAEARACLKKTRSREIGSNRRQLAMVAAILFILLLLPAITPFALRVAADIPILGPWARKVVLTDAGQSWAWKNGYVLAAPIVLERDGYKLTVIGYMADPLQTSLIYLIDGPGLQEDMDEYQELCEVRLTGSKSNYLSSSIPIRTPLGLLRVAQTSAAVATGEEMTVSLVVGGESESAKLWVTPEPVATLSSEQQVNQTVNVGGAPLTLRRIVRTPAQMMLEITCGQDFRVSFNPVVRLDNGETLRFNRDTQLYRPLPDGNGAYVQLVFDPPRGANAIALELDEVFIPEEIEGPTIDPAQGLTEATINEGSVQVHLQVWENSDARPGSDDLERGLSVQFSESGYQQSGNSGLRWDCYTAAGAVYDSDAIEINRTLGIYPMDEGASLVEHFWRRDGGDPIVKVKVKEISLPYGPIVFDLK